MLASGWGRKKQKSDTTGAVTCGRGPSGSSSTAAVACLWSSRHAAVGAGAGACCGKVPFGHAPELHRSVSATQAGRPAAEMTPTFQSPRLAMAQARKSWRECGSRGRKIACCCACEAWQIRRLQNVRASSQSFLHGHGSDGMFARGAGSRLMPRGGRSSRNASGVVFLLLIFAIRGGPFRRRQKVTDSPRLARTSDPNPRQCPARWGQALF
jgi:hypothetical protein